MSVIYVYRKSQNGVFEQACVNLNLPVQEIGFGSCDIRAFKFDAALSDFEKESLDARMAELGYSFGWVSPPGPPPAAFYASSKIVPGEESVASQTWEVIGGVVTNPSFFIPDLNKALGKLLGQAKVSGSGAQIRVVEEKEGEADVVVIGPFDVPDSGGAWVVFNQPSHTVARSGDLIYRVEAQLNGATSMEVRFTTMSLLELVVNP